MPWEEENKVWFLSRTKVFTVLQNESSLKENASTKLCDKWVYDRSIFIETVITEVRTMERYSCDSVFYSFETLFSKFGYFYFFSLTLLTRMAFLYKLLWDFQSCLACS